MSSDPALVVRGRGDHAATPALADASTRNRMLRALPAEEVARLRSLLEPVAIAPLQRLAEPGQALEHVWFPETAIVSVVRCMRDGSLIEAGTVGREGVAGLAVLLGEPWTPSALIGQVPGRCLRAPFDLLGAALPTLPALDGRIRRAALAFLDQVAQGVACNTLHTVEQRCARWLLTAHDGVDGDEFHLTHEALAQMLAVRRAGVTEAALALQRAGVIRYWRGHVHVLDRAGLEGASCECYAVVRAHRTRLLGPGHAHDASDGARDLMAGQLPD